VTPADVVAEGVAAFYPLEATQATAISQTAPLTQMVNDAYAQGMISPAEKQMYLNTVTSLAGQAAQLRANTIAFHLQAIAIAVRNGVDVPEPDAGGIRNS
jgi:hypothetical protein